MRLEASAVFMHIAFLMQTQTEKNLLLLGRDYVVKGSEKGSLERAVSSFSLVDAGGWR